MTKKWLSKIEKFVANEVESSIFIDIEPEFDYNEKLATKKAKEIAKKVLADERMMQVIVDAILYSTDEAEEAIEEAMNTLKENGLLSY